MISSSMFYLAKLYLIRQYIAMMQWIQKVSTKQVKEGKIYLIKTVNPFRRKT